MKRYILNLAQQLPAVLLATAYTSRTINRLYAEFFPEGPDGKPKVGAGVALDLLLCFSSMILGTQEQRTWRGH